MSDDVKGPYINHPMVIVKNDLGQIVNKVLRARGRA